MVRSGVIIMEFIRVTRSRALGSPLGAALMLFAASAAFAQQKDEQLGEIRVYGNQPQPDPSLTLPNIETAQRRLGQTAGGANVVDGERYREGRVSTLNDALAYSPGVFSASRFGAEEARLSIRGSGIQRTFHLRGIKLMQDGVPLNLADGSGDFQAIEPLQTRYIEVYRGANALQYGSSSLGGAINYVSVTGYDNWPFLARAEAGSWGYLRSQISAGKAKDDFDWIATYSTFNQDGFRRHAHQAAQRATGNAGYRFSDDVETRFFFSVANSDSQLPGNLTKAQLQADPRQANAANISGNQKRDIDWGRLSNRTVWRFGEAYLEASAYYSERTLFHPIFQVFDQENRDVGGQLRWVSERPLLGRRNILTAGFAPSRGTIKEDRWINAGGNRGARTNRFDQLATNRELYVENQHYVTPQTAVVLGVQHADNRRRSTDLFIAPGEGDESFDVRYRRTSPKLGVRYEITPAVQFFANVAGSHEPPSFGELTGGLRPFVPNAQKGRTVEVGSRGVLRDLQWDVALYRARVRDELLQTQVFLAGNAGAPAPQTVNVPRTVHEGLELGTGGRFLTRFEWRQALFINRFRFDNDPAFGNNTLPGLPKSLLKAELVYRMPAGFFVGANAETSPQRYPVDMANTLYADPYTIWGAKIGQRISATWSWFVEGRNLSDRKYAATTGVTLNQAGADAPQFLPGDGRSYYAGVEWKL
jgi:iron complex outermembrane receptor protein